MFKCLLAFVVLLCLGCGPSREDEYRRLLKEVEQAEYMLKIHVDITEDLRARLRNGEKGVLPEVSQRNTDEAKMREELKELRVQLDIAKARLH